MTAAALTYGGMAVSALTIAAVWLLGCTESASSPPPPVGPVPAVSAKNDFVAAHAHAIRLILSDLAGVELAPSAKLLVQRAQAHAEAIAAVVPPPGEPNRKTAEAMRPADLPVVLARAAELAGSERDALNAAAENRQRESERDAAKRQSDAVVAAKRQARLDALAEVFTWLAGLAGLVSGVATLAAAASLVISIPVLADARRALACVAAVSLALVAVFSGAVMALNYPWVFAVLGAALVSALGFGGWYLLRLPSPGTVTARS